MKHQILLRTLWVLVLLTGCRGNQSALDAAGIQSHRIGRLWWFLCAVLGTVYLVVLIFTMGVIGRKSGVDPAPQLVSPTAGENLRCRMVTIAVGLTTLLLLVFLISEFATARAIYSLSDPNPLTIKITGHQWWWEVQYEDPQPDKMVITANEIHLPVGKTVKFELQSSDVIHSFWIPNLHGKKDLVPGHPTTMWLRADRTGEFRGQCAEFCGAQHAQMRLSVFVQGADEFQGWLNAQRQPGAQPASASQRRGQQIVLTGTCAMCHSIAGTDARGTVGPNLTHIASRAKIAAGARPNEPGQLAKWVADSQSIKPGTKMPQHNLSQDDLRAVLDYLEILK